MKAFRRVLCFAERNLKEILRDPVTLFFGLAFPLILLVLMSIIQANIPVDIFNIRHLAPGIAVFGQSFLALFTAFLVSRDRGSALLARLYATPTRAGEFLTGYMLPMLPVALLQGIIVYGAAAILGLALTARVLAALLVGVVISLLYIALGLLCGTLLNERQAGSICGALLTNLSAWLSGVWFDVSLLGGAFGAVCRALPFYHAVEACRALVAGTGGAAGHMAVVMAYALALMAAAVICFHRRMKKGV